MFHITFLVDDKKFGEVMAGLANKVMNLDFKHVVNVVEKKGKAVQKHSAGTITGALLDAMIEDYPAIANGQAFTKTMVGATIEKLGGSAASTQSTLRRLLEAKAIRRLQRGSYVITKKGAK